MNTKKTTIYDCSLIHFAKIGDRKGNISPIENSLHIPFDINRVFYIYDIPAGKDRGGHAHYNCHQLLISVSGSFDVLIDDGKSKKAFMLNRPFIGLHIPPGIWAEEFGYSAGSVCLVLASEKYDNEDYIRDYDEYLRVKNE